MVMSKTGKTSSIQVNCERLVICAKYINTHIEFTATKKHWIQKISLADILLDRGVSGRCLPSCYVVDFVEYENTFALAFGSLNFLKYVQVS